MMLRRRLEVRRVGSRMLSCWRWRVFEIRWSTLAPHNYSSTHSRVYNLLTIHLYCSKRWLKRWKNNSPTYSIQKKTKMYPTKYNSKVFWISCHVVSEWWRPKVFVFVQVLGQFGKLKIRGDELFMNINILYATVKLKLRGLRYSGAISEGRNGRAKHRQT